MGNVLERVEKEVMRKANVVGFSMKPKPKIVAGKETDVKAIRIYVKKKVRVDELRSEDVIPSSIDDIPTDVVEIGEVNALIDKKGKFRPLVAGISIGNIAITAGTLGWFFEDKKGNVYLGSNAHVFVSDPSKPPSKVHPKTIIQPGRYDGGLPADAVGEYYWHEQIVPEGGHRSTCPVARLWAGVYNAFAKVFGARTRLEPVVKKDNYIDFAVAKPTVALETRVVDVDEEGLFVGLLFAGSDRVTVVCKAEHIVKTGYVPMDRAITDVDVGDVVWKSGRTTCHTRARVIDESAVIRVNYGGFTAVFKDVILTGNMSSPGDSGSSVWLS